MCFDILALKYQWPTHTFEWSYSFKHELYLLINMKSFKQSAPIDDLNVFLMRFMQKILKYFIFEYGQTVKQYSRR